MYDDKFLNMMKPFISIDYLVEPGFLRGGQFEDVPKEAFGASIYQGFITVRADGEFVANGDSFRLYVGQELNIDNELNYVQDKEIAKRLAELKATGHKKAVVPAYPENDLKKPNIWPLYEEDVVLSSNEELAERISKIYQTFNSVVYEVRNSTQELEVATTKSL